MNAFLGISFTALGIFFLLGVGFALFTGLIGIAFAEEAFVSAESGDHCLSEPAQIGDCFLPITSNILLNETVTIVNNMDRELFIKPFYEDRQGQTEEFNNGIVLLSSETAVINFTRVGHYSFYDDNRKSMLGEVYVEKVPKIDVCHNGHIITIDMHALSAHLEHGDTEYICEVNDLKEIEQFSNNTQLLLSNGGTHNPPPKQLKMDILSTLIRDIYDKHPEVFIESYRDYLREAGIIE